MTMGYRKDRDTFIASMTSEGVLTKAIKAIAVLLVVATFAHFLNVADAQRQARVLYQIENGSGPVCQ
jgi:hypothetical protein